MKILLYILLLIFPVLGYSQPETTPASDLELFTTPLTKNQTQDSYHTEMFFDSIIKVSNGINIQTTLRKQTSQWPNGSIQYIRYYHGLIPYGNWVYFTQENDTLYTLQNHQNYVLLKSFMEPNDITRIRKFSSIENVESATCAEQLVFPNGYILAAGSRKPIQIIDHTELLETGKWKYFFKNGILESTGKFKNGQKNGKWVFYNKSGYKIRTVNFKNGELISQKNHAK